MVEEIERARRRDLTWVEMWMSDGSENVAKSCGESSPAHESKTCKSYLIRIFSPGSESPQK